LCAVVVAGCSSGGSIAAGDKSGNSSAGCKQVTDAKVTVVTKSFDFEPKCLTSAGPTLTVRYDNTEEGVSHNFHLKGAKSASGADRTDLQSGPDVQTITYVALKPGTYSYVCDLHPSMKGTLTVTATK
jgi:plastocyanin